MKVSKALDNSVELGGKMTFSDSRTFELIWRSLTAARLCSPCDREIAVWGTVNQTARVGLPEGEKR